MKHLLTALLLALAVAAGLLLPELAMEWQDSALETAQTIELPEPVLEWDPSKPELASVVTSEDIARRLELFEIGPATAVPIGTATTDDVLWAASRAIEFLNLACEVEPDVAIGDAEYQLAWFEDGTTVNFWTACVGFNGSWVCIMTIDAESGAILQCILNGNGADLAELFPDSFTRAANEPGASFEELVTERFTDALGYFMGRNDGGANPVMPGPEPGLVTVTFADTPELAVPAFFTVDLTEGINFNNPGQFG